MTMMDLHGFSRHPSFFSPRADGPLRTVQMWPWALRQSRVGRDLFQMSFRTVHFTRRSHPLTMPPMSFVGIVTKAGFMNKTATVTVSRWVIDKITGKVGGDQFNVLLIALPYNPT